MVVVTLALHSLSSSQSCYQLCVVSTSWRRSRAEMKRQGEQGNWNVLPAHTICFCIRTTTNTANTNSQRNKTVNRCNPPCYQSELKLKISYVMFFLQCIYQNKSRCPFLHCLSQSHLQKDTRRDLWGGVFWKGDSKVDRFHTREELDIASQQWMLWFLWFIKPWGVSSFFRNN